MVESLDLYFFQLVNQWVGRSWLIDSLMAYPLRNELVKAVPLAAVLMILWFREGTPEQNVRARRAVMVGIVAGAMALVATQVIAKKCIRPRPFVYSSQVLLLRDGQLQEQATIAVRKPADYHTRLAYENLATGEVRMNDLGSFPSDHAGLYVAMALAVLAGSRWLGSLAVGWTLLVILGSKIYTGMHWMSDIVAGIAIAGVAVALASAVVQGPLHRPTDGIIAWTQRHPGLSAGMLFIVLFEICSTLKNFSQILYTFRQSVA